ncbi:MAG: hypothetical protein JSS60_07535 [Verrucomicrobia bacterium]|nr:hypothetical protein [Verrucomicrobiota bacterium]
MKLKGKALFNLLKISWLEDRNSDVQQWQVEDLRDLSIEDLFSRLKSIGLILNEESFYLYAENCESPEELADCVWFEEDDLEGHDKAYLLLFELWRRLLPGKMCLSVFCDEIDQMIDLYDSGEMENEETLQNALSMLEDVLDEAYDEEGDPQAIFSAVADYCAHDLERFIFDYISDQIIEKNETYASELVDAFYDYSSDRRRFDLLRARLFAISDLEESNIIYGRILEELADEPDLELVAQVAESLIRHGDVRLFMQAIKQALPLLRTEEEFQSLLALCAEYYRCLDRDAEEKTIKGLLDERSSRPLEKAIEPTDKALERISQMISIHFKE